jgi:hypothetical protein
VIVAFMSVAVPRGASASESEGAAKTDAKEPRAGYLSKYTIDESNPESSVPTTAQRDENPVEYGYFIMDLGDHAQWAVRDGDHKKAALLYRALAKAVPDMAVGYVKACEEYEALKDTESAIGNCGAALSMKGTTLADYSHYARLVLQKKALTPADLANLDSVVQHLKDNQAEPVALDIECTLGAHEGDVGRLQDCAPKLAALAPGNPKALLYQWALAIQRKDFRAAEHFLAEAKSNSAAKEQVAQMERATVSAMPVWRRGLRAFRDWRVGAACSVTLALGLSFLLLRRREVRPTQGI